MALVPCRTCKGVGKVKPLKANACGKIIKPETVECNSCLDTRAMWVQNAK